MATHELNPTSEIVVATPMSRWRLVRGILTFGLTGVLFAAMAAIALSRLLTDETAGLLRRSSYLVLIAFSILVAVVNLIILGLVWKRPFAIRDAGIELQGTLMPWEDIQSCSWAYYTPFFLTVRTRRARLIVPIPRLHRARVEQALRAFGKWRETAGRGKAQTLEEPSLH